MLLDFIGWKEAAKLLRRHGEDHSAEVRTYDFERQTAGATKVGTSEFATRSLQHVTNTDDRFRFQMTAIWSNCHL